MPTRNSTRATGGGVFVTTHWTEVLNASEGSSPQAAAAMESLCKKYWYPLYVFIRRAGHNSHDAQDLTQGFFAKLLEKDYLAEVHPSRGKFRSFLLASFQNHLSNQFDCARRLKRGGDREFVRLDAEEAEERYRLEPVEYLTAEKMFDARWAMTLLSSFEQTAPGVCCRGKNVHVRSVEGFP